MKAITQSSICELFGEAMGTFLLVLFGCGSVAVATLYSSFSGIAQIAAIWGIGVTFAIYAVRSISCAHLNPAVTLAMTVTKRMPWKKAPYYVAGQLFGATAAALLLLLLFGPSIEHFETAHGIVRGSPESAATARIFGEFYLIESSPATPSSMLRACAVEATGTSILILAIFCLSEGCNIGRPSTQIAPMLIGAILAALISVFAPLTQAGFNPARDLCPRLVAFLAGWGDAAFPDSTAGFLVVYVVGPLIGSLVASLIFVAVVARALRSRTSTSCLSCE